MKIIPCSSPVYFFNFLSLLFKCVVAFTIYIDRRDIDTNIEVGGENKWLREVEHRERSNQEKKNKKNVNYNNFPSSLLFILILISHASGDA